MSTRRSFILLLSVCHLLTLDPAWAQASDPGLIRIVWHAPGHMYPVLGWRMPVDLSDSDWRVDRAVKELGDSHYNCHYYTRLHLVAHVRPEHMNRWLSVPRHDAITPACLRAAGLRPLEEGEPVQPGDIIVTGHPADHGEIRFNHSAVVREVSEDGLVVRIRQKFDGRNPVVDVALDEFRMLYAGMHPYRIEIWGWPSAGRAQVARR